MQARTIANGPDSFGWPARVLHWLVAGLVMAAIVLGLLAGALPHDDGVALARKATVYSAHKTVGVAAFLMALLRIGWALTQPRPLPLQPQRRLEVLAAEAVHWALYLALVLVPLSGWVHHAATTGFAPIWWPLGQGLPLVPRSDAVAAAAGLAHWLFTKVLLVVLVLHVAGALKHHLIDRDATLLRMWRGVVAGPAATVRHGIAGVVLACVAWGGAVAVALALAAGGAAEGPVAPGLAPAGASGNWRVQEGRIGFAVRQIGARVEGGFADWQAEIRFDEVARAGRHGDVRVEIGTGSVTLGSVTPQVQGAEFLDVTAHPLAVFEAAILPDGAGGHVAEGTLALRGVVVPVRLPFDLVIEGDVARMTGAAVLDRRDFGIGAGYGDEATVGFAVEVSVEVSALRVD